MILPLLLWQLVLLLELFFPRLTLWLRLPLHPVEERLALPASKQDLGDAPTEGRFDVDGIALTVRTNDLAGIHRQAECWLSLGHGIASSRFLKRIFSNRFSGIPGAPLRRMDRCQDLAWPAIPSGTSKVSPTALRKRSRRSESGASR